MSDAETAYAAAQALIEQAREDGASEISFDTEDCHALTRIPPEIADLTALTLVDLDNTAITDLAPLSPLTGLQRLDLDQTGVTDLTPLSPLTGLQILWLNQTGVTDLAPLSPLTGLQRLYLDQTGVTDLTALSPLTGLQRLDLDQTGVTDLAPLSPLTGLRDLHLDGTEVIDLRPLRDLDRLGTAGPPGLSFRYTPATAHDAKLAWLAGLKNPKDRAEQTRAYLHTLPPWPEPLPWDTTQAASPTRPENAMATPVDEASVAPMPLPNGLPRRITAHRARHVLQAHSEDLRTQCQFVTGQINQTLAEQIPAKPNDPDQLAAWTHLVNTLELSRAAIISLHDAIPAQADERPVTDDEANRLRQAFETAIATLQKASAYIDGPGEAHGRTYAGLLKIGVCSALAAPIALISAQPVALIGGGLYAMLYGKGAALDVVKAIGATPDPRSDDTA